MPSNTDAMPMASVVQLHLTMSNPLCRFSMCGKAEHSKPRVQVVLTYIAPHDNSWRLKIRFKGASAVEPSLQNS
jgi:hypothetical protein